MGKQELVAPPFPWFMDGTVTVDDLGRVWRNKVDGRPVEPRRIDLVDHSKGYRNVVLPVDGKWVTLKAHRLVWAWHHGRMPRGQIDHINGVKDDNRIENLEDVDASTNISRSYANGRTRPWSLTASVSDKRVEMIERRSQGATFKQIAGEFGISITHAHRLARKEVEL